MGAGERLIFYGLLNNFVFSFPLHIFRSDGDLGLAVQNSEILNHGVLLLHFK